VTGAGDTVIATVYSTARIRAQGRGRHHNTAVVAVSGSVLSGDSRGSQGSPRIIRHPSRSSCRRLTTTITVKVAMSRP
jgi:hypothetical protein